MELILLFLAVFALILFPGVCSKGALEGLRLCGSSLIPGLLPFLFLTRMLADRVPHIKGNRKILGMPLSSLPGMAMSFIGGYPSGVVTTVNLYKNEKISRREAQRLIPYCNNSGPGFFISVLGLRVFDQAKTGVLLYAIHVITAVMVYLLCYREEMYPVEIRSVRQETKKPFPMLFQEALSDSCSTMLRVCGLVILFSVFRQCITQFLPVGFLKYMGLLELSSGLLSTGKSDFVLWAVLMGWGGVCVHMQAMSIWQEAGLHVKGYFSKKILHGVLSGVCAVAVAWHKWYMIPVFFLLCCVFFRIHKNWGRKKRQDRL